MNEMSGVKSLPPEQAGILGRRGEDIVASYLESLGCSILKRNYRTRRGEIDLIVSEGQTTVFVEVKSRSSLSSGDPGERVGTRKRRRIIRAAISYLLTAGGLDVPCRFDTAIVDFHKGGSAPIITLIKNSFDLDTQS
ncbi:MAG TPA: YraN family protein [Firmicutes bacterium]|nr:YraN family protein [Bacillota bacterium]